MQSQPNPLIRQSETERTCPDCNRSFTADVWKTRKWGERCNMCQKRLWRQSGSPAVEKEREAARRWKRQHLGQPGLPKGAPRAA